MNDCYREVALEFPLLCSIIPDKYDCVTDFLFRHIQNLLYGSVICCCEGRLVYSVHKNIGLFVPAIPKHLRMSACLEEQMEGGYENMYYRVPDNPTLYNCKVCGKTVSNRWHHTRSHKPQNLKCPLCQQVFTRKDNMKTHLKWKHGSLSV